MRSLHKPKLLFISFHIYSQSRVVRLESFRLHRSSGAILFRIYGKSAANATQRHSTFVYVNGKSASRQGTLIILSVLRFAEPSSSHEAIECDIKVFCEWIILWISLQTRKKNCSFSFNPVVGAVSGGGADGVADGGADAAVLCFASINLLSDFSVLLRCHEFPSSFVFVRLPRSSIKFVLFSNEEDRATAPAALARKTSKRIPFYAIKLMKLSFIVSWLCARDQAACPFSNWTFNMNETSLAHSLVRWCLTNIYISSVFRYLMSQTPMPIQA